MFFGSFIDFVLASFVFNIFFTFWKTERKNIDIIHFESTSSENEYVNEYLDSESYWWFYIEIKKVFSVQFTSI